MENDLLAYRETLLSIAFYGTIGAVALWETVAEFRSPQRSPLVRWSNNIALGILGFALERWLLLATGLGAALYARHEGWGLLNNVAVPEPVLIVLSVLFLDLLFYGIHRVWHAIPLLWRFHCVHHSDTEFDFSVGFRRHPVELLVNAMLVVPLIIVLGIPVVASGGVSSIKDVEALLPLQASGVIGVIIGKALYSGTLDLKAALELSLQPNFDVD